MNPWTLTAIVPCHRLAKHKRRDFSHRIVTGDEKLIHYDNPKRKKSWGLSGHASKSTAKPYIHDKKLLLCIWWDQLGVVYYQLLKPNETISGAVYRTQLMRLSRALKEKRTHYYSRHEKVNLQHNNVRPHVAVPVKTYLERLKWGVLPHSPYLPDIASDFHLFRSMTRGKRWKILRIKHKVPFFHNKCPIFDEKRRKLICTPNILLASAC